MGPWARGPVIYPSQAPGTPWNTQLPMEPEITRFQQLRFLKFLRPSESLALICQTSHFWSETELLIEVLVRVSQLTMNRLYESN